ncbi:hypothetical protein SAMN05444678_102196 [Sphingomonas sp. YR710]|jgi:uncharacterized protein YqjF (DUF2071 family)|uniref:hypothetical protein n=1 Tax=Sphingomonas sp. YR710 TaxID=1882773 RepID=UPI00088F2F7D|nr:hypothetical protein [Sphingomonas sp. YR710]SDC28781.1 hypothetical protein SAMN05444678_102196 [Sphingomonas sp. YR710]
MAHDPHIHDLPSPVDLPRDAHSARHPLQWTAVTIAVATVALLVTNPGALSDWIGERDPTPIQLKASELADHWTALMDQAGMTAPRQKLHALWKQGQAKRFGNEASTATP